METLIALATFAGAFVAAFAAAFSRIPVAEDRKLALETAQPPPLDTQVLGIVETSANTTLVLTREIQAMRTEQAAERDARQKFEEEMKQQMQQLKQENQRLSEDNTNLTARVDKQSRIIAALRAKLQAQGINLTDEEIELLANQAKNNEAA